MASQDLYQEYGDEQDTDVAPEQLTDSLVGGTNKVKHGGWGGVWAIPQQPTQPGAPDGA